MKIENLPLVRFNNNQPYHIGTTASEKELYLGNGDYAPLYYKDYNVNLNFKGRSPEDFYEQEFNKKNMPKTMAEYLHSDFDDRHHLPPVQLMNEAFDDLSVASAVEDIRELYPDEPLFDKLKPANYFSASRGVLRKIGEVKTEYIKEGLEPEPLFKDGSDDLTVYIVKKIFLEGKTVKEIDKDFEIDLSDLYKGIIKSISSQTTKTLKEGESKYFSNSTTYSLGIRFPNISFWNSLISTRDDYERVERRKIAGKFENAGKNLSNVGNAERTSKNPSADEANGEPVKPKKMSVHRPNVKKIADTIAESKGDMQKIRSGLNRTVRGSKELSFVQKYWSEIMSVATEKVHLSEELSLFYEKLNKANESVGTENSDILDNFVNGVDLSDENTNLLKRFWNYHSNDNLKDNFSEAISSTIKEFAEAYNEDGYSEEFEIMLNYARNIKPEREKAKALHDELQLQYDELGRQLQLGGDISHEFGDSNAELESSISGKGAKYSFTLGNGIKFNCDFDPRKMFEDALKSSLSILPDSYLRCKLEDFRSYFKSDEDYLRFAVSFCEGDLVIPENLRQYVYSEDEVTEMAREAKKIYVHRNQKMMNALNVVLLDYYVKNGVSSDNLKKIDAFNVVSVDSMAGFLSDKVFENNKQKLNGLKVEIGNSYNLLLKSTLSNKDLRAISCMTYDYILNYNMDDILEYSGTAAPKLLFLISNAVINSNDEAKKIKEFISENIAKYCDEIGPAASYILRQDGDENIKKVLIERILVDMIAENPLVVAKMVMYNINVFNLLMNDFPELRDAYLNFVTASYLNNMSPSELMLFNVYTKRRLGNII